VSGVILVIVGLLMMFDYFTVIAASLQKITPAALRSRL
jgi:hypothetical protein